MSIILVPHDSNWSAMFHGEKEALLAILDDVATDIEHIGSTAIPGICAKPIIDILIGVKQLDQITQMYIERIEALGYQYIKIYEKDLPFRRFFIKKDQDQHRLFHIHLVNRHSAWWERHILFRDFLRNHHHEARQYEALKWQLAATANGSGTDAQCKKRFYDQHIAPFPALINSYQELKDILGDDFTLGNQYALAKSPLIESINEKAYFDFTVHQPTVRTERLHGYLPQLSCFKQYKTMFQDPQFVQCFGVKFNDEKINDILKRDSDYWDQYQFAPYVWFDKETQDFVGEGGLNHTQVEGNSEIELTYSLSKQYWGRGLAVEIGRFAVDYAFRVLQLDSIVCFTMTTNRQSLSVIEKLGFVYENDFIHANLAHQLFRLKSDDFTSR